MPDADIIARVTSERLPAPTPAGRWQLTFSFCVTQAGHELAFSFAVHDAGAVPLASWRAFAAGRLPRLPLGGERGLRELRQGRDGAAPRHYDLLYRAPSAYCDDVSASFRVPAALLEDQLRAAVRDSAWRHYGSDDEECSGDDLYD